MWQKIIMAGMVLLLVACSSQRNVKPPAPQAMGLLKVTFSGIGEGASPTATAEWVTGTSSGASSGTSSGASSKPGISGQAATIVPVNGSNALGDVEFTRRLVSFDDDDLAGVRFVRATFDLVNRTTTNFDNFTLYAVNAPGNLGGTGIVGMSAGTGVAISDPAVARSFKPTHGMQSSLTALEVHPTIADLQFFTPAEAATMQTQGLNTNDPFNPPNKILPVGSTVLEYGFVARNLSGSRAIASPNTGTPSNCTTDACKGTVTLAYQFPKVSPRNANPFAFSLYFLVANETASSYSQSLEEQAAGTVTGLSTSTVPGFGSQLRVLVGSGLLFEDRLKPLCRAKYATSPDLFLGPDPLPSTPGSLDICFGVGGKRTTAIGSNDDSAYSMVIQPDGKIVVAGETNNGSFDDFALVRYNTDGSLDTSFGSLGKAITEFGSGHDRAYSIALQSDGKIVVAGYAVLGSNNPHFALARYNTNGTLDLTFDGDTTMPGFPGNGKVTTAIGSGSDQAYSVAIYPSTAGPNANKIVVAGVGNSNFALARYNTNGTLDTTFDTDGKQNTDFGSSTDLANSLAIQSDGKIVLAGYTSIVGNQVFALARYNTNGTLDTSFDSDGKLTTDFDIGDERANEMAIQSDGKIVVAGVDSFDFALARYNVDGSLDTTFDVDGKVTTDFGNNDSAYSMVIQPDGKIVLAGTSNNSGIADIALARYNTDGSLDTSFDTDGKVTTSIGSNSEIANSIAIQPNGKIVVAGWSYNGSNNDFALVRYNP